MTKSNNKYSEVCVFKENALFELFSDMLLSQCCCHSVSALNLSYLYLTFPTKLSNEALTQFQSCGKIVKHCHSTHNKQEVMMPLKLLLIH